MYSFYMIKMTTKIEEYSIREYVSKKTFEIKTKRNMVWNGTDHGEK